MSGVQDEAPSSKKESSSAEERAATQAVREARAREACAKLVKEMDPEFLKEYFSDEVSAEVQERSNEVVKLILGLVEKGAARNCMEKGARREAEQSNHEEDTKEPVNDGDHRILDADPFVKTISDLYDTAQDDDAFAFLCLLFDKDREESFRTFAEPYLEIYQPMESKLTGIRRDVLVHAQWKCFGIKDRAEHQKREKELLCISKSVVLVRDGYGLSSYSEIRDRYV